MEFKQWDGFNKAGEWTKEIDVRGFIQFNYTPYEGDSKFLKGATDKTKKLWNEVLELYKKERENGGVLDADCKTPSSVNAYEAGYIDKDLEEIVILSTCNRSEIYRAASANHTRSSATAVSRVYSSIKIRIVL